jgi:TRAP-type C4-dicarboxylate transport system permease small subunit
VAVGRRWPPEKEEALLVAQQEDPPADDGRAANSRPNESFSSDELLKRLEFDEAVEGPPLLPSREPMRTIFRILGMLEQVIGSLLLIMILILVLAQVAIRYLPGSAAWTGELARLSMVWATFLMAGYLVAYPPHHIAIQVVDYVAKGKMLIVVKLFVNLVILATCLFMVYGSYTLVTTTVSQVTPAGGISLRFVNSIPLIGLILVAIRAALGIVIRDIPALRGQNADAA